MTWRVLKFGGTSVATPARWDVIAQRARELAPTHRVWIVVSALAGVSNRLEAAVQESLRGASETESLAWIEARHRELARGACVEGAYTDIATILDDVRRLLDGVRLTGEAPPRLRARVLAAGELASSRLGAAILAARGIDAKLVDARELLTAESPPGDRAESRYLEARVPDPADAARAEELAQGASVVLTQGFIARTAGGDTCLLGRGGSDTSGALFAALLRADELEIWSDVQGLFTADPRQIPTARLIRRIGYREAQELASMGAKVLHPRCLGPVARAGIPLQLHSTERPTDEGTRIEADDEQHPAVTAIACRNGVVLVTISTLAMWETSGFLARVFAPFEECGVSVDLVATSEAAVSVTLDDVPGGLHGERLQALLARLAPLGGVNVIHPCSVLSLVGRRIRTVLHELGPAFEAFRDRPVHLLTQSSEDLNLSFVVDEGEADALQVRLHEQLFATHGADERLGPTWEVLQGGGAAPARGATWWVPERARLLALAADGRAKYVYDLATVTRRAHQLVESLPAVGRFYYAMKANSHPEILAAVAACGFGIECVSIDEVRAARAATGPRTALLFTPNFCPLEEYGAALEAGAEVTLDGPHVLEQAPERFRGLELALRIDPGHGTGHHEKVRTAGARTKFGQPLAEVDAWLEAAARLGIRTRGLHAHVGSGVVDPATWERTGRLLSGLLERFPDTRWLDLGGGLGVAERPGQSGLDLAALNARLSALRPLLAGRELRLEPGRFLVSEAGVLLAPVTQVRAKRGVRFVGVATGMNSLIRPALYGAWHSIHNLTRLDERPHEYVQVVGPICESADVLGRDRRLPPTRPGDVLLIENAGAYGAAMASRYNLREPAEEIVLRGAS